MLRFVQWLGYCFRRALDRRRTRRPHSQADLNQHPVRGWRKAAMTAVTVPVNEPVAEQQTAARGPMSDRARSEQRLGWRVVTPAVVVILVVTAYPLGRAVYLSLCSYRLTDPAGKEFVGIRNYGVVLTDSLWWQTVFTTLVITAVTVAVELVIGFAF